MKRLEMLISVVLTLCLVGACDHVVDPTASDSEQTGIHADNLGKTTVVVLESGGVFFNPCTGEDIEWSGFTRIRQNDNGDMLGLVSVATGVGLSTGTIYNIPLAINFAARANRNNDQTVVNTILRENIVARGPLQNTRFDVTIRSIVNANGETKVEVVLRVIECFGGNGS